MTRIEVEVRDVAHRILVVIDTAAGSAGNALPPSPEHASITGRALADEATWRRLTIAGGSVLAAAGLALGQALARRWSDPQLRPGPVRHLQPLVGRVRAAAPLPVRVAKAVRALPSGPSSPAR
jgi:hypothetical protein